MLGKAHAGQTGRDRAELTADFGRGVGLRVEGVDVAGAALEPEEDATRRRPTGGSGVGRGSVSQAQNARQAQPEGGEAADAQERPPGNTRTVGRTARHKVEHTRYPEAKGGREVC